MRSEILLGLLVCVADGDTGSFDAVFGVWFLFV